MISQDFYCIFDQINAAFFRLQNPTVHVLVCLIFRQLQKIVQDIKKNDDSLFNRLKRCVIFCIHLHVLSLRHQSENRRKETSADCPPTHLLSLPLFIRRNSPKKPVRCGVHDRNDVKSTTKHLLLMKEHLRYQNIQKCMCSL